MPENVGWIHRWVGTRQIVNMLDAGTVVEIKWWSLWWYWKSPSRVLPACLRSPFYVSPLQILNWKTQSYVPDLPLSSWELFGKVQGKESKAIPVAYKSLHCKAPGYLCSSPMPTLPFPHHTKQLPVSGPLHLRPLLPGKLFLRRVAWLSLTSIAFLHLIWAIGVSR